jgi:hypothetical protein
MYIYRLCVGCGHSLTGSGKSHCGLCFILYRLTFFSITNPIGATPAITQEASNKMVL